MKKLLTELNNQRLSLLFSIMLTYWAMTSFFGNPIVDILVIIAVVNTVLYICYIFLKRQGISGGILFVLGSIVYFIGVRAIILFSGKPMLSYLIWLIVSNPEAVELVPAFWFATIFVAAYGFSSTVYYFTNIHYRVPILLLIGAIPFMLQSAKTDSYVTLPFLLFGILFFWLYIEYTAKETSDQKSGFHINNPWYILSASVFIGVTLSLSLVVPKPETIPKIAYIKQVINETVQGLTQANVQNIDNANLANITGIFNTMGIKKQSVISSITPPLGDNILFEVEADESLYFRVQSWDKYINNRWIKGNDKLDEKKNIQDIKNSYYKFPVLLELIQRMEKNGLLPSKYSELYNNSKGTSETFRMRQASVYTKGVPMETLLNPPGAVEFGLPQKSAVYINDRSECYIENGQMPHLNEYYVIDYFSPNLSHSSLGYDIIRYLNREFALEVFDLNKYKVGEGENELSEGLLVIDSKTEKIIEEAIEEMNSAYENYTELPDNISQRIYDLANSITEGLTSDYDKAEAIANFFHTSGFKYDLTPRTLPKGKEYNDYFIFESKRGICVHFASAMVILARAAGLPARYVEGFVANEWDPETGKYLIREKDAHAFPEVYISGYGWMVFEPTVGRDGSSSRSNGFFGGLFETVKSIASGMWNFIVIMPFWVKLLFIPYTIFVLLMLTWIFFRIRRSIWRKKVLKNQKSQAISMIFAKISHLLKKIDLGIEKHETPSGYAVRVLEASGLNLLEFAENFNKYKYGGLEPDENAIFRAMEKYEETRQVVKMKAGKLKAWLV